MLLSKLKPVATLQYKAEGPHVLFYMTTTKANQVSGITEQRGEGVAGYNYILIPRLGSLGTRLHYNKATP